MSLRLRRLNLRAQTSAGLYGVDIPFDDGLVLIRADNSMGKSTCFLAIIYALGLERMLGPSDKIPLPHVMTEYISQGIPVIESEVLLEIANAAGDVLTIQRQIVGTNDTRLIRTWEGAQLSDSSTSHPKNDYYVRDPGAATHDAGFHNRLARFLGWELPSVARYNGGDSPLYLEAIFPLFFVEQKHGWAGVQANLPTYLGIREVGKRALEFVLNLDAAQLAARRQELEQEGQALKAAWREHLTALAETVRSINGRVVNLPDSPTAQWPLAVFPQFELYRSEAWVGASLVLNKDAEELAALEAEGVPTAEESASELQSLLGSYRQKIYETELLSRELFNQAESEKAQVRAARSRLTALEDDLQRNKDAQKLRTFGSITELRVSDHHCPTCHQDVDDALLSQMSSRQSMSIEDNIAFIHSQIQTFKKLEANGLQVYARKEAELIAVRGQLHGYRAQVRAIKQTLTSPSDSPSYEAVRERVELQERISSTQRVQESFEEQMEAFAGLSKRWTENQVALRALPRDGLTPTDAQKLRRFEVLIREQLVEFGLQSIEPDSLSISESSYQVVREGFNLGFDLSASDNIRVIWAYLQGLLELAAEKQMRHTGLIVFDEPGQQQVADLSFEQLLRRASTCGKRQQQVVFFTSEKLIDLERMTQSLPKSIVHFPGRVITPQFES